MSIPPNSLIGLHVAGIAMPLALCRLQMNIDWMIAARAAAAMQRLREESTVILPSLLLCDFGNLAGEISRLEEAGVKALHLDVMDGHFVPNLTYGMPIVEGIRRLTELPIDVHLMIDQPSKYVRQFVNAGADCLTIHAEIQEDHCQVLQTIRDLGVGAGLAVNPGTSLDCIQDAISYCDLLLIMSVDAGFGGQSFNPIALEKIRQLRDQASDVLLEVDGGVNLETIASCRVAGATLFVVGSAIFKQSDYRVAVDQLSHALAG